MKSECKSCKLFLKWAAFQGTDDPVQVLTYHLQIQMGLFLRSDATGNVTFLLGPEESREPRLLCCWQLHYQHHLFGSSAENSLAPTPPCSSGLLGAPCSTSNRRGVWSTGHSQRHRRHKNMPGINRKISRDKKHFQSLVGMAVCKYSALALMSHSLEEKKHDLLWPIPGRLGGG